MDQSVQVLYAKMFCQPLKKKRNGFCVLNDVPLSSEQVFNLQTVPEQVRVPLVSWC